MKEKLQSTAVLLTALLAAGCTQPAQYASPYDGRVPYDGTDPAQGHAPQFVPKTYYPPPGPVSDPWGPFIHEAVARYQVPEQWVRAIMQQESGGQEQAVSPAGAMGLMQVRPETYEDLRTRHPLGADPFEPHNNIMAGVAYIREMYNKYGAPSFLAAYNAGPDRLDQYLSGAAPLPDDTVNYVAALAPTLVRTSAFSGPLAVYASANANVPVAPQPTIASLAAGCDVNTAYDPSHPCVPLEQSAVAPADAPAVLPTAPDVPPTPAVPVSSTLAPAAVPAVSSPVVAAPAVPFSSRLPAGAGVTATAGPSMLPVPPVPVGPATLAPMPAVASRTVAMPPLPIPPQAPPLPASAGSASSLPLPVPPTMPGLARPQVPAQSSTLAMSAGPRPRVITTTAAMPVVAPVPLPPPTGAVTVTAKPAPASGQVATGQVARGQVGGWAIQVGAFNSPSLARAMAEDARAELPDQLRTASVTLPPTSASNGPALYRARLGNLSANAATTACERLAYHQLPCAVVSPESY